MRRIAVGVLSTHRIGESLKGEGKEKKASMRERLGEWDMGNFAMESERAHPFISFFVSQGKKAESALFFGGRLVTLERVIKAKWSLCAKGYI